MPKFVIERYIPGAGKLSPEQLQAISQKSCGVLKGMGPRIQWVHSYVTDDKVYCVYIAPDAGTVREHAQQGGFPANRISQVRTVINPATSEQHVFRTRSCMRPGRRCGTAPPGRFRALRAGKPVSQRCP